MKDDLENINTLIFDVDGTLVDSTRLILETFHQTFRALGLPDRSDEEILSRVGKPLHVQVRELHPERERELYDTYQELYRRNHDLLIREIPGIREALRTLAEGGYRLGVVTSKRRFSTRRDLESFRLQPFFEVVITAEDTGKHKPDPEPVLEALYRLGSVPGEAAFIGDSPYDLRSAHSAGVTAGAVSWSPFPREVLEREKPDFWVPSPADLPRLFPGLRGGGRGEGRVKGFPPLG
jgi:pyrophosphatase PpaX